MGAVPIGLHLTAIVGETPHRVARRTNGLLGGDVLVLLVQKVVINHTLNIIGSLGVVKGRLHDPFDFGIFVI